MGKSNVDVEGLFLMSQRLNEIPKNLGQFFPNLKSIDLTKAELLTLSAFHLEPFVDLIYFRAWANNLVSIPGDLFHHNTKLQYIDFDGNRLQHVGYNLLGELRSLQTVDFNYNPCINIVATTPLTISNLNQLLPISCPPLATTTTTKIITETPTTTTQFPEQCSLRCTLGDEFDKLKSEVAKLNLKTVSQSEAIEETKVEVAKLRESNARLSSESKTIHSKVTNLESLVTAKTESIELLTEQQSNLTKSNVQQDDNILALTNLNLQQTVEISRLSSETSELFSKVADQNRDIQGYKMRLTELEKLVRENPRLPFSQNKSAM
jgi:protein-tyrosine-phosphatase